MITIWKFQLMFIDQQVLRVPMGAHVLSVQIQNGIPCLWIVVDDTRPHVERVVYTFGTGHHLNIEMSKPFDFVGTYQLDDFVGHVFVSREGER